VNKRGEIYITSSVVGGVYAIRVVSANPKAEKKYLRKAFQILVETAEEIRDGKTRTEAGDGAMLDIKGVGEAAFVNGVAK